MSYSYLQACGCIFLEIEAFLQLSKNPDACDVDATYKGRHRIEDLDHRRAPRHRQTKDWESDLRRAPWTSDELPTSVYAV